MMNQESIKQVYRESKVGSHLLDQNDVISIGNNIVIENHERPFTRNRFSFQSANKEYIKRESVIENIFGLVIKFVGFLTVAVIFWTILRFGISNVGDTIEIYPGTIVSICIFFLALIIAIYFLSAKKKLKLRLDENSLHITSFPNFSQKIPAQYVSACYTDISNGLHYDNRIDFSDFERSRKAKVDLERGLLIQLKNGKNFTISSSNSPFVKNIAN